MRAEDGQPLSFPIDMSSAFYFADSAALERTHKTKFSSVRYSRDGGGSQIQLERELEAWHPGFEAPKSSKANHLSFS